jgi:alkylation response protein AidB-like acyl-CoA dehydrogenase
MLLDVESARSAAYYAAGVLDDDDDDDDPSIAAALAKAHCSAAYTRVAAENIQIHGGIGFTWEHPAHLFFKRAKTSEILLGDPVWHRERLAALVGI